ncbi:hypothetical protein BGZ58_008988 [Dissophora ornata]|nr:hypothetical protein BGZ58_008988 [Dissophora ornata]
MNQPPHIDVKYRKRCKSVSHLAGLQPDHTESGYERGSDNMTDVNSYPTSTRHYSLLTPSLQTTGGGVHTTKATQRQCDHIRMLSMDDDEDIRAFGEELYRQHAAEMVESPISQFKDHVVHRDLPRLNLPPLGKNPSAYSRGIVELDYGLKIKDDQGGPEDGGPDSFLSLPLPPPHANPRPSISPSRKNPLSAESSRASSLSPSPSRRSSGSPSPLNRAPQPLRYGVNFNEQLNKAIPTTSTSSCYEEQTSPKSGDPQLLLLPEQQQRGSDSSVTTDNQDNEGDDGDGGRHYYHDLKEDQELPAPSPKFLDIIQNDQDHWRSPTLSALASPSTSRSHSPSGGGVDASGSSKMERHGRSVSAEEAKVVDMTVEIPLIEAHDEVSLQDIWRMEDEERKDRINSNKSDINGDGGAGGDDVMGSSIEDHITHMKGKEHAREEAKLIRELLHGDPYHHLSPSPSSQPQPQPQPQPRP